MIISLPAALLATALVTTLLLLQRNKHLEERNRRLRTESALRSRNAELQVVFERLRTLLSVSPDAVFFKDGAGRWVEVNQAAIDLFELGDLDYHGLRDSEIAAHTPAFRDALIYCERTDEVAWQHGKLSRCEEVIPQPAGGTRTLDVYKIPLFHRDGRRHGLVVIGRDISDRKRAEEEQARLLTSERAARAAAEEAIRVRDEFLSVASHELRLPCNSLLLGIQALSRLSKEGSTEGVAPTLWRSALATSERQARKLVELINRLLDLARLRAGLRLDPTEMDLAALCREVTASMQDELGRAGCSLTVSAEGPVLGLWDRSRVEQVLVNLLANAARYASGKPVEVRVARVGDHARLEVRDQGIGIAKADQARIFERFTRAASSEHYGGLGLGLYITHEIVRAHGGSVAIESEPGQGATFQIDLPLAPPG